MLDRKWIPGNAQPTGRQRLKVTTHSKCRREKPPMDSLFKVRDKGGELGPRKVTNSFCIHFAQ